MRGKLFVLIGPSGVGKGTIIKNLKKRNSNWIFPISATTREKRPHEKNGETYFFFSREEFLRREENGEFLETAKVHQKNFYGLLKKTIFDALKNGEIIFREIDIQGFSSLREKIPEQNFCSIFLLPPSLEILKKRIISRAPLSENEISNRMKSAENEIEKSRECDFRVQTFDGEIEKAVREIEKVVAENFWNWNGERD